MSLFSVVADGQSGLFRLQQAKKPWEKELEAKDAQGQLAQKAARAQGQLRPSPDWLRNQGTAQAALEEARRVGSPKAAAAARLEQVERRIEEIKLAMRFARGDAQKLASLARDAALLAREAGRAAKEYGAGIKAAAELGLPGDMAAAGGGGAITTSVNVSVSSMTLQQTEITLDIGISAGDDAGAERSADAAADVAAGAADGLAAETARLADGGCAGGAGLPGGHLPEEAARLVGQVLAEIGSAGLAGGAAANGGVGGGSASPDRQASIRAMMSDNALTMSRYREADAFGRRVETVLAASRRIIGEAKAANMADVSEARRRERRDGFKADDRMVGAAQSEVDALRASALVSPASGPGGGKAVQDGKAGDMGGQDAGPAAASAAPAPVLDLLT
ncbi:hypothetical protein [Azospirillum picis]|uniref:Uncharacterized protein n=1 Tax=Azospirillum picis TaxID=488438 RepID=A0ABU0MU18_9PROT|nr:hypothetical protein [Azospirillum picis]MBP2302899.1 hypothetical protein [Azospirillum picis]MDQ0536596.1 hypothetical protein [Azospirillum picis]